ncbi:MAG: DUF2992 family protein [Deltaproteobacteria bacterium]|nr:DUF2992 family protein [Deltaproteobacteria bacterium]
MESGITTIFFDGQYWIAMAEKNMVDGTHLLAKHTFGPDPTWNDIQHYYINIYPRLAFRQTTNADVPLKKKWKHTDANKNITRSQQAYSAAQEACLQQKKKQRKQQRDLSKQEKYNQKQERKKEKRRGR